MGTKRGRDDEIGPPVPQSSADREFLAAEVNRRGARMPRCTRCTEKGLECKVFPDRSKRCGCCIAAGMSKCDVTGFSARGVCLLFLLERSC